MPDSALTALLSYLEQCDGEDRHVFTTVDGLPDTDAARQFAETIRAQAGSQLGELVEVEQRVNVVRVTSHCATIDCA